jgi:membrane-associated phospholipid phosphatase
VLRRPSAPSPGSGAPVAALLALAVAAAGCRSDTGGNRFERHFSTPIWSGAYQEQLEHPEQSVPALDLLVATPLLMLSDDEISEDALHHATGGSTTGGDYMAIAFGVGVGAIGIADAAEGKGTGALEIGAESLAATAAVTQVLKVAVHRHRPTGSSTESFPSGHASFSFASATFIARYVDDASDGRGNGLGYFAYVPATYVGLSRIEGQRHFASDVTFGAFLGVFLTNWIYNAHRAEPGEDRPTIDVPAGKVAWRLKPEIEGSQLSVCLSFSF